MNARYEAYVDQILIDSARAADLLSISPRKLGELGNTGAISRVVIGRAVRFRLADLHRWVERGCPCGEVKR